MRLGRSPRDQDKFTTPPTRGIEMGTDVRASKRNCTSIFPVKILLLIGTFCYRETFEPQRESLRNPSLDASIKLYWQKDISCMRRVSSGDLNHHLRIKNPVLYQVELRAQSKLMVTNTIRSVKLVVDDLYCP